MYPRLALNLLRWPWTSDPPCLPSQVPGWKARTLPPYLVLCSAGGITPRTSGMQDKHSASWAHPCQNMDSKSLIFNPFKGKLLLLNYGSVLKTDAFRDPAVRLVVCPLKVCLLRQIIGHKQNRWPFDPLWFLVFKSLLLLIILGDFPKWSLILLQMPFPRLHVHLFPLCWILTYVTIPLVSYLPISFFRLFKNPDPLVNQLFFLTIKEKDMSLVCSPFSPSFRWGFWWADLSPSLLLTAQDDCLEFPYMFLNVVVE